jgi:hypothetical protein
MQVVGSLTLQEIKPVLLDVSAAQFATCFDFSRHGAKLDSSVKIEEIEGIKVDPTVVLVHCK